MPGNPMNPDLRIVRKPGLEKVIDPDKTILRGPPVISPPVRIEVDREKMPDLDIHWVEEVIRPEDLLKLRFEGINLMRKEGNLVQIKPEKPAYLVVHFPPQNYAEEAIFESAGFPIKRPPEVKPEDWHDPDVNQNGSTKDAPAEPTSGTTVLSAPSGPTRLVYEVPPDTPIPYDLVSLLSVMTGSFKGKLFPLKVVPAAVPPPSLSVMAHLAGDSILKAAELMRSKILAKSINAGSVAALTKSTVKAETMGSLMVTSWEARSELANLASRIERKKMVPGTLTPVKLPPKLRAPGYDPSGEKPSETAIELPYHLILSPYARSQWDHAVSLNEREYDPQPTPPITRIFRHELWHTRLEEPTVRAVWTTDWTDGARWPNGLHEPFDPFRMSLDRTDRENIVHLSANFTNLVSMGASFTPGAITLNRLMLSSLGGWLDSEGKWELQNGVTQDPVTFEGEKPSASLSVSQWRHIATMGRDQYVKVVYDGYLFPFRHRASLVKVTERKFCPTEKGKPEPRVAILRQRLYIVVRDPILFYDGKVDGAEMSTPEGYSYERHFPFQSVRIVTTVTPDLAPMDAHNPLNSTQNCFVPHVKGGIFKFHIIAEDMAGTKLEFRMPLFFHDLSVLSPDEIRNKMVKHFSPDPVNPTPNILNSCDLPGTSMAFAPSSTPGDTRFEVKKLVFGVQTDANISALKPPPSSFVRLESGPIHIPPYYPRLELAEIIIPAVKQLSTMNKETSVPVKYYNPYLANEFDKEKNAGQVYLRIVGEGIPMSLGGGSHSVGLVEPNMTILGLSRSMGPVSGKPSANDPAGDPLKDLLQNGTLDPAKFFEGAKIFGVIPLSAIIPGITDLAGGGSIPKLLTTSLSAVQLFTKDLADLDDLLSKIPENQRSTLPDITRVEKAIGDISTLLENAGKALLGGSQPEAAAWDTLIQNVRIIVDAIPKLRKALPGLSGVDAEVTRILQVLGVIEKTVGNVDNFVGNLKNAFSSEDLRITYQWTIAQLKNWGPDPDNPVFVGDKAALVLNMDLRPKSALSSGESVMTVACAIQNFDLCLFGLLGMHFNRIEFKNENGKKIDVNADFEQPQFHGFLSFINVIQRCIPGSGFSDPPGVSVTAQGITAAYSLALPPITVGVFSLQHMKLGASLELPFLGRAPNFVFSFCEPEDPFLVTVYIFGGEGYLQLSGAIAGSDGGDGQLAISGALGFGGAISLNFGVASGCVVVMGGLTFWYQVAGEDSLNTIAGYFKIHGEVDVLHLISASIELYLKLAYQPTEKVVKGSAKLTIEVEIFLFSTSVTLYTERTFVGSDKSEDPTFADMMKTENLPDYSTPYPFAEKPVCPWETYCKAFAPIPEVK